MRLNYYLALWVLVVLTTSSLCVARDSIQKKQEAKDLRIIVNSVAPIGSPSNSYKYYSLPFLQPKIQVRSDQTFAQSLSGDRLYNSPYLSKIGVNITREEIGTKKLDQRDIQRFIEAINEQYYAEFYVEDFPVHDFIGNEFFDKNGTQHVYLKTHVDFNVYLNKDEPEFVIFANLTSEVEDSDFFLQYKQLDGVKADTELEVTFTYSVSYFLVDQADIDYEKDYIFTKYQTEEGSEISSELHMIAIILSFLLVILLVTSVSLVLARILKKDFSFSSDVGSDFTFEIGWKLIRTEALMPPAHKVILSCLLGNGVQFLFITVNLILLGSLGLYYNAHKGDVKQVGIFLYTVTGVFNGYYSNKFYKLFGGIHWALNAIASALIFPISLLCVFMVVNSYAWFKESTSAIPAGALLLVVLIQLIIFVPLTLIGTLTSRMRAGETLPSANTSRLLKPIPNKKIHQTAIVHFLIGGFIPFSSIYLELRQIFSSVWGYSTYHLYGVISLAFILFLVVQACVAISLTYQQLNSMDYNWWWRSFSYGGSTSLFIAAYVVYFYSEVSSMHGTLQFLMYFGYMVLACLVSFFMLGTVSFLASMKFVRYIYNNSKAD